MKALVAAALWLPLVHSLPAQLGQLDAPRTKAKQLVAYASEAQVLPAGKRTTLELRFRVQGGYHVNSHKPNSELQIPTVVDLEPEAGVRLEMAQYPAGKTYTLSSDAGENLDVYSDEFTVKFPVTAQSGSHELHGELRYQACDHAACYPPKTLPLDVIFTAK